MKISFSRLTEQRKILILSSITGIGSGLASVFLYYAVKFVSGLLNNGFQSGSYRWQYLLFPGIGMLLAGLLVRYVIRDNISHGVTKSLLAVSRNESRIKPHNIWSSVATSALTIGFGGSVGAEAPIVYTGAAIGSNIGRKCGLSYKGITTLLCCGAAGAVAGIFKAPLAGVLFTLEILLFNVSLASILPLLISTITATVVAFIFRGQDAMFACALTEFQMINLPFYLVLGVAAGFCALYFMNATLKLEDWMAKHMKGPWKRWALCAVSLGVLIFLFPSLYGEGYEIVGALLNGNADAIVSSGSPLSAICSIPPGIPVMFLLIFIFKVLAMTFTNAGGGVGGTFGPTLFAGAIVGFSVARILNLSLAGSGISVPEQNFVLVGMAALMAGVMQAPLTAIFLIAEISGGYALLLPLIFTSTITFATVRIFERYSIYTKRIAQSGDLLTHDSDQSVLTLMKIDDLIRDKYPRVHPDQTLGEFVEVISETSAAVVAVLDDEGRFDGMVDIGNVRRVLFDTAQYGTMKVSDIMEPAPAFVWSDEKMDKVISKFDRTGAWRLPVLTRDKQYLGFVSRSRIMTAYRAELKKIVQED